MPTNPQPQEKRIKGMNRTKIERLLMVEQTWFEYVQTRRDGSTAYWFTPEGKRLSLDLSDAELAARLEFEMAAGLTVTYPEAVPGETSEAASERSSGVSGVL